MVDGGLEREACAGGWLGECEHDDLIGEHVPPPPGLRLHRRCETQEVAKPGGVEVCDPQEVLHATRFRPAAGAEQGRTDLRGSRDLGLSSCVAWRAHASGVNGVEDVPYAAVAETHSAAVFFLGDVAWKVKKPVDLGFLDFQTLAQ